MKRWLVAFPLALACGAVCPNDKEVSRPAKPGTYLLAQVPTECDEAPVSPLVSDAELHQLILSADRRQVTETYVRDGKSYVVVYDVTSIDWL
jgi:hypothetical protein